MYRHRFKRSFNLISMVIQFYHYWCYELHEQQAHKSTFSIVFARGHLKCSIHDEVLE